jgi:hypothetical protein
MPEAVAGFFAFVMVAIIVAISLAIQSAVVYYGWNLGVAPLFELKEMTLRIAFFCTLLIDVVIGAARHVRK